MNTTKIFFHLCLTCILFNCISDPVVKNLTIENNSANTILFCLIKNPKYIDSLFVNAYCKNKSDFLNAEYCVEPHERGYIITNRSWDDLATNDTSVCYLYILNIDLLDSLKNSFNDLNKIRNKSERIYMLTFKQLKEMNWTIKYP
ncbi:MAG: hypothetical protein ACP5PZ_12240 [Bacteroidales bacterium]